MKRNINKFCAATTIAAVLLSASPLATSVAHAGWGSVIGGVIGGILNGGGSGGSSGGGNGGGSLNGLSNQQHAHPHPNNNEKLFMLAVKKHDFGTVNDMLNAGVDINGVYKTDSREETPLYAAFKNKDREMMQFLLEHGADANGYYLFNNNYICYLVRAAIEYEDPEILQYLHNWGADINGTEYPSGANALNGCFEGALAWGGAANNGVEKARYLLENGIKTECIPKNGFFHPMNFEFGYGRTPFLGAVGANWPDMMELLANSGANINAKDANGKSALDIALAKQNLTLCKQVQDIMARGQQPSQYQPSQPHTQRRPAESNGNVSGDDELIKVGNKTSKTTRIQELHNFNDIVLKAIRAERKANEPLDQYVKEHPGTMSIADRSTLSKNYIAAIEKVKASIEPQPLLDNLNHLSFDEKETCSDLLQIMNTRYDKVIESYSLLALNRELTLEEQEKIKTLLAEVQSLGESVIDMSGRVDKLSQQ